MALSNDALKDIAYDLFEYKTMPFNLPRLFENGKLFAKPMNRSEVEIYHFMNTTLM